MRGKIPELTASNQPHPKNQIFSRNMFFFLGQSKKPENIKYFSSVLISESASDGIIVCACFGKQDSQESCVSNIPICFQPKIKLQVPMLRADSIRLAW